MKPSHHGGLRKCSWPRSTITILVLIFDNVCAEQCLKVAGIRNEPFEFEYKLTETKVAGRYTIVTKAMTRMAIASR